MSHTLRVAEVFAPAIQGEGPYAGRSCAFVRLMGCNLSCSWCDTAWTWDAERFDLRAGQNLAAARDIGTLIGRDTDLVIITGGEPLLQQDDPAWLELLALLRGRRITVQVETNGTIAPSSASLCYVSTWVVSPKLANAGPHRGHQNPALHPEWGRLVDRYDVHLKYVCRDEDDVYEACVAADVCGWPSRRLWVMPEGATAAELEKNWPPVAEAARAAGINASHRLHVLAWGDVRGR